MMIPGFRAALAVQDGVETKLLFRTWGGLGDQICAEPTLRFALNRFKGCRFFLASERPELFRHLSFERVFDLNKERPVYEQYLLLDTITPPNDTNLVWQFFGHLTTNCVDFPSLCALRSMLPIAGKSIFLVGTPCGERVEGRIVIHPGKHWPSKTFPKEWWNAVIKELVIAGRVPVIIGANTDDNRSTVDIDPAGCLDLRNQLSVSESIWVCQNAGVVLTNDSAPLHMAASCDPANFGSEFGPWIGYVATCKHPDMITHWRHGDWGWRMKNHGLDGIWNHIDYCPNKDQQVTVDEFDPVPCLPDPAKLADWALSKLN